MQKLHIIRRGLAKRIVHTVEAKRFYVIHHMIHYLFTRLYHPLSRTCVTAVRLKGQHPADKKRLWTRWGAVALLTLALYVLGQLLIWMIQKAGGHISTMETSYVVFNLAQNLIDWARIMAFTAALTETLRYIKQRKE